MTVAELIQSGRFDASWYRREYPDVEQSGMSPAEHFLLIGHALGRPASADEAGTRPTTPRAGDPLQVPNHPPFQGFGIIRHNPLISVLIVSFNSGKDLEILLPTIARQTYTNLEVVLVENGTEDTEPLLARHFSHYRFVRADNVGFADANNIAVELASGELLALINPDTRLDDGMIQHLLDALRFDQEAAVAVPKIYFFERFVHVTISANAPFWIAHDDVVRGRDYRKYFVRWGTEEGGRILSDAEGRIAIDLPYEGPHTAHIILNALETELTECALQIGYSDAVGKTFSDSRQFALDLVFDAANCASARYIINNAGSDLDLAGNPYDRGFGQFDDGAFFAKAYVNALCGCAALIRRSAILNRKLFVPAFFAYYEDSELSHWLRSQGYRILYQPAAVMYHRHSESTSESSPLWQVLVGRSRKLYDLATHRESLPPQFFRYDYPADFEHPLLPKLAKLDAVVRASQMVDDMSTHGRRMACVYNSYFSTMGGGEKHALDIANLLTDDYEVFLASESDFSIDALQNYFSVPLKDVKKIVSTSIDSHFSSKFDLFVNSTFRSNLRARARDNFYIVSFPHEDMDLSLLQDYTFLHNSDFTARWANDYWGKHKSNVLLPIVGQNYVFETRGQVFRKSKSILSVGRITSEGHCKNQHRILEAFRAIADQPGHDNSWKLILIGSCNFLDRASVRYYRLLQDLAQGYNVELLVNQPRNVLDAAYSDAAIYVHATGLDVPTALPERHEHFGIAPFEAMARGCLPVVYHEGGPAYQVARAGYGVCFADFEGLIAAVEKSMGLVVANEIPHDTIARAAKDIFEDNLRVAKRILLEPQDAPVQSAS
jgi:GT2 family glycosyltransferase